MADRVITIPEPTASSAGVTITIDRRSGGAISVRVHYENQGNTFNGSFTDADLTAAQQTTLNNLITACVGKAKTQMGF